MLVANQNGLRMYFFVMYNLSGIQKGIQAGHAALEYANTFKDDPIYNEFIKDHKTFILLDGGGSGDMLDRALEVQNLNIQYEAFFEPDLNGSMSAIAFILKESQYDCKLDEWDENQWWYSCDDKRVYDYIRKFRLASN
jgi:hypothetical protein